MFVLAAAPIGEEEVGDDDSEEVAAIGDLEPTFCMLLCVGGLLDRPVAR
jgi:hypothetical protein